MRKNIIQKIAICVLSGTILISLAACGANQTETKKADSIRTDAIKANESQKADEAVIGSNKTNSYEKIFEKSVSVDNKKKNIFSEEQLAMILSAVCLLTGCSGNQSGVSSSPQELPRFPNRRQRTPA